MNTAANNHFPNEFIDSAVYQALNELWNGNINTAQDRLLNAVSDSRLIATDALFWDATNRVVVDKLRGIGATGEATAAAVLSHTFSRASNAQ